jgi:hypothetical protein
MIKYDIIVCCYDKLLVNVVVYEILNNIKYNIGLTLVRCVCVCGALIRNKLPEDCVLTPKHVGVILILILHYLFLYMLVYNKHVYIDLN